jgi:hypothetical protein
VGGGGGTVVVDGASGAVVGAGDEGTPVVAVVAGSCGVVVEPQAWVIVPMPYCIASFIGL